MARYSLGYSPTVDAGTRWMVYDNVGRRYVAAFPNREAGEKWMIARELRNATLKAK